MSLRASTAWPRSCSGEMQASVPTALPSAVRAVTVSSPLSLSPDCRIRFAKPKSITPAWPVCVSMILAGLMSRWMIPFPCAASSASATSTAICSASPSGNDPRRSSSFSDWPSTYSITMKSRPSDFPTSLMWRIYGWSSALQTGPRGWSV
jgi:hypothetical protein